MQTQSSKKQALLADSTSRAMSRSKQKVSIRGLLVLVGFVGLPLWCVLAIIIDRLGLRSTPHGTFDAIVVAGCRVLPDGSPSRSLNRRALKAVELWKQGVAPVIAFTGGVGTWPPAEAVVAANVARSQGVPDLALIIEDQSTSTLENARYLRRLVPYQRILVVTDSYHVRRCEWFFRKYFGEVHGVGVISPFWDRAKGAFREVIAYAGYVVMRALSSAGSRSSP
jgi:uncharacterized SAM-binding protein YcdF (DUF218 family)